MKCILCGKNFEQIGVEEVCKECKEAYAIPEEKALNDIEHRIAKKEITAISFAEVMCNILGCVMLLCIVITLISNFINTEELIVSITEIVYGIIASTGFFFMATVLKHMRNIIDIKNNSFELLLKSAGNNVSFFEMVRDKGFDMKGN